MSEYKRLTERYIDEQGSKCVRKLAWDGEILHRLAELEDRIENGTLVELPRIIHPNEQEWFVQYQYETGEYVKIPSMRKIGDNKWVVYFYENGLIHNGIYYTEERAKIKLKQVNGD